MSFLDFKHLNDNLLCSVAIVTTGQNPELHDILSVCILPVSHTFKISKEFKPLYLRLKPRFPENAKAPPKLLNGLQYYIEEGMDYFESAVVFDRWFEKLGLKDNKKIAPLSHQFQRVRPFLIDWLGPINYDDRFSEEIRDLTPYALGLNDRAARRGERCPYPKHNLSYYRTHLDLTPLPIIDALELAKCYVELYERMT